MMAPRIMVAVVYAFIAVAVCPVIFSAPTPRTCAPLICTQSQPSVINYEQGKSYIYNFDTEVETQLVGSTDETNRIKVKGQAAVAAVSTCELVLTIQNVALTSSSGQSISRAKDVEGSSIRFGYKDGEIDNVCISDDDPSYSANIKRAIVSMLGNRAFTGATETIETDINGKCRTIYEVAGNTYKKTKDLLSCTRREGGSADYGVPYDIPSKYNSVPFFQSTLECTQELGKGVIQNVECVEGHAMSVIERTGVRTDIKSVLALANIESSVIKGKEPNKKSCLLYDFGETEDGQKQKASASNAIDLLNKICNEIDTGTVSSKVPGLFIQLRKQVKHAKKDDLKLMHDQVSNGKICPKAVNQLGKIFLDAAALAAGDGPIAFLSEVIANSDAVEQSTKDQFLVSIVLADRPHAQALEGVLPLVAKGSTEPDLLLAVTGLAHQYCKMTDPQCGSNQKYQNLVNAVSQHVKVATDEETVEKVIVALQALGNLDVLTPTAVTAVKNVIDDSHTCQRVKVRALDAFRRDPCQETLKQKALKIFSDIQESSQVRIQAYLTFSKCLTAEDVPAIQAIIDNDEESNQVGSFVVSHVSNLLESSSPGKQPLKKVFELLKLREFPSDVRTRSRNYEFSVFDSSLVNSGVSLDTNVIFSQDSYIPRCTSANFTVDAVGRSYNLMEVGLCIQNFEDIIERLIGPTSKLRTTTLEDIIREGAEKLSKLKSSVSNRFKRDVAVSVHDNEIDAIKNEVDIHERTDDNASGDLYVRVLGTSITAESFSRNGLAHNPLKTRLFRALENIAQGAKEQNVDITEPFTFLEEEVILPTSSGLPITLNVEGTSILSLQIHGNMDVASLFRGDNADMRAKVMPSAATVVKGKMTVGSGPMESGLQVEAKLHSAAGAELKVVREGGKFELRANLPQERIQVFDIRSDVYWVEQTMDQLEKKTPMKTKLSSTPLFENDCFTSLGKVVGLKLCADAKIPQSSSAAPFFIFNGPSVASLYIEKIEPSMEGYYLKIEKIQEQDTYGLDLVLDTPGSRTNRKITAQGRAIAPGSAAPEYKLKVETPLNNLEMNYKRSYTDALKGVEFNVAVDGEAYNAKAEVRKTADGAGYKLNPLIQYQLPQGNPVKLLEGEITRVPGEKLHVDIKTGGPFRSMKGSVKGDVIISKNDAENCEVEYKDLEFASEVAGKVLLSGNYKRTGHLYALKFDSNYGQTAQHTLSVDATAGSPSPRHNVLKLKTRSSRRTFLNFDIDWSLKREDNKMEHKFEYLRGVDEPKVHIKQSTEIEIKARNDFDIESELTIKHPAYHIDFEAEVEAESKPGKERHAKVELKAGDNLKAKASYEGSGTGLANYKIVGTLEVGNKKYEASEVCTKVDDNRRKYKTRVSVQPGFYYEANTDVFLKYQKGELNTDLSTEITSDQLENPITLKSTVTAKRDGYGALLKLNAEGKSYLDLETSHQVTRAAGSPSTYATKMKAHILNLLDAKLTNSYSNGNGDLVLDVLLVKSGRKIAGTSKIAHNGDVYDWKADLKWDAERDPSKAATLKSTTTLAYSELRLDSQNEITIVGKTAKVHLKGSLARDLLNGENTGEFEYTSPSGKTYGVKSKLELENKLKTRAGKLTLRISPAEVQPSDLEIGVRATNLDSREQTFDLKGDFKANYRQQKDFKIHGELSSTLPGNYRSYAGRISADGSAIPKPLAASFKTDVKSGRIAINGESTSPVQSSLDATIDYDYWSAKRTVGVKYSITTPIDRIKNLEGEVQTAYLFNSIKNFELSHEISVKLNGGSPYGSSYLLSVLENEAKYSHKIISEGNAVITVAADGKYDRRSLRGSLNSDVKGVVSKLNLEVEHQLPNIDIVLSGQSNLFDNDPDFELKISNKKNADGTYDSELSVRSKDEDKFSVTNKLEYKPTKKSVDLQVIVGDEPARKLFLVFEKADGKYNVEALAKWGEGDNYVSTKGNLKKLDNGIEGELSLDSPYLKANKFSVRVSKSLNNGEHGVNIDVDGNNKKQFTISLTYAKRSPSDYEKVFEGTLKAEGQAAGRPVDFKGTFRFDDTTLDRQRDNGEEGRRLRANIEITNNNKPSKLNLISKRSNKENRVQLTLCTDSETECSVGTIQLKHDHSDNGNLDYELRVTTEKTSGGASTETNGIIFRSTLNRAQKHFEHSAKLIINSEKAEHIGYRLYCTPGGKEVGGEIVLPARIIALVATGDKAANGGYNGEIAFYIDKTKKANRKVSLLLNIGGRTETPDHASKRSVEFVLKHPDLTKDLKVKSSFAFGGESTLFETETLLDVLQAGNEINFLYRISKEVVSDGRAYSSILSVVSQGLHINTEAKGEVMYKGRELSYKNVISYQNRNGQTRTTQTHLGVRVDRFEFGIEGPDGKVISFLSRYSAVPSGHEIRYEVFLPGMADTRTIKAVANTVSPRSVQLITSVSSNPPQQFVEAFLGFRSADELAAGIYDHLADGRHVVADVSLALNGARILDVKSDWKKENAQAILTRVQERGEKNFERLRDSVSNCIDELIKEVRHVSSNIRNAVPDLSVVVNSARAQLQELEQEMKQHEDTRLILQSYTIAKGYARYFVRVVAELARSARRIALAYLGGLRAALKEIPERYSDVLDRLPEYLEQIRVMANKGISVLMKGTEVATKVLLETAQRFYESLPPFADAWNWLVDHTEGFAQVGYELVQKVSEKLASIYRGVRDLVDQLMANRTIQAFVSELRNRLQSLLEEFIEDVKENLEVVKDYILESVPQKEFAEFIEALIDYIQKKANKASVDDAAAIRGIYEKLKATVTKVFSDVFTIDLQKGIFRAQIPLPVSLKSLSEFTKIFVFPSKPKISFRIPSYTYGLRELINQIRSGAAINELTPPFKGYALLVGSKHYKTFDGRFFEFEGNCQYLLASDFDDGNFTVVVDYDRQNDVSKKAIIVTDGHDTVALKPDNTVAVNGQTVEIDLPSEAGTLLIERIGDWNIVRSNKGAVVGCSVREDVCAVKVDGFYHGKVLGMLGTMNLEIYDDLRKPSGEISPSVGPFVESWKLDKTCPEPLIMTTMIQSTQSAEQKCRAALDNRGSSLRPCFGVVDPTPYRNICEKLSNKAGYTEEKAVCTAAVGYAKACYLSYAKVDPVPACSA